MDIRVRFTQIAGGSHHSIVTTDGGDCYTFGDGTHGQLGNGSFERVLALSKTLSPNDLITSDIPPSSHAPLHVKDLGSRIVHVSAGDRNSACIDSNGQCYTWGYDGSTGGSSGSEGGQYNHVSRIGLGPSKPFVAGDLANLRVSESEWQKRTHTRPRLVHFNADRPIIKMLSCGADHTLCVSIDGDTFSWGLGEFGQLGHGTVANHDWPQIVDNLRGMGVTDVACGAKHSVVITVTGKAMSFGFGGNGRLGNDWIQGTLSPSSVVFQRNEDDTRQGDSRGSSKNNTTGVFPIQVDAGESHTGFVSKSGMAYTCGCGGYGRLGHGEETDVRIATRIDSLRSFGCCVQIACGAFHTVVLMASGELYGVGSDRYGQLGQGGGDEGENKRRRAKNFLAPSLIRSKATSSYNQVSCGRHHTLALTSENRAVAWGYGVDGQLGMAKSRTAEDDAALSLTRENDTKESEFIGDNIYRPHTIESLLDKQVSGVSEVKMESSGSSSSSRSSSSSNSTGDNSGQQENGKDGKTSGPMSGSYGQNLVQGFSHLHRTSFCMVACGHFHTLALTAGGKVWAWGDNSKGQLGVFTNGSTSDIDLIRQSASAAVRSAHYNYHRPTLVDASFGSSPCAFIACGGHHSMGISSKSGELYTWGDGGDGQLGDGMDTATKRAIGSEKENKGDNNRDGHTLATPSLVSALTLKHRRIVYVSGGEDNSAAVLNDGTLYMWGNTARGKLGCGTPNSVVVNVPQVVTFQNTKPSPCIVQVSLGTEHTGCVDSQGRTYMWGSGYYGKLGFGHRRNVYYPELVRTLRGHPCRMISCGSQHTMAVTVAGDLFTWGRGDERLGLENFVDHDGPNAKSYSGSNNSSNSSNFNSSKDIDVPTLVTSFRDMSMSVYSACASQHHSMVVDVDGRLWTFGRSGALDLQSYYGTLGTASSLTGTLETVGGGNKDNNLESTWRPKRVTSLYDFAIGKSDKGYLHLGTPTSGSAGNRSSIKPPIASLSNHCIAVTSFGDIYTWGCGVYGRLGHAAESTALYQAAMEETKLKNIQLEEEDMELLAKPRRPKLNPMETTARKVISPYLALIDVLRESSRIQQGAAQMLLEEEMRKKSTRRRGGRGGKSEKSAIGISSGSGSSVVGGDSFGETGPGGRNSNDGGDGGGSGSGRGSGRDVGGSGGEFGSSIGAGGGDDSGDGGNGAGGGIESGADRTGIHGIGEMGGKGIIGDKRTGKGRGQDISGSGQDGSRQGDFSGGSRTSDGSGVGGSGFGGSGRDGGSLLDGDKGRAVDGDEEGGEDDDFGMGGSGMGRAGQGGSEQGGLEQGESVTSGDGSSRGASGGLSDGTEFRSMAAGIDSSDSRRSGGGGGDSGDGGGEDGGGGGGGGGDDGGGGGEIQVEPELLGAGPTITKLGLAVQKWETRRISPPVGFVLRALNAEPSEHTEASLQKVLQYIDQQKAIVHRLLVQNENVEIETAEIQRNVEWVVKATVGALYPGVMKQMEKNSIFEEHGNTVPHDISVHSHVLELIFSLMLVNPGYLLRLYTSFVSDSSRMSRRLQNVTSSAAAIATNSNSGGGNNNERQGPHKTAATTTNGNSFNSSSRIIPERILQHDLRFVDLCFDVYGNLENRYNENRFLVLCRNVLQEEMQGIAERTGSNFPLFASRFASGTTVFGRLAKRYFRQPHIVKAASKVLSTQLNAVLDQLTSGSFDLSKIYRNRHIQNEEDVILSPEEVDPMEEPGLYTYDYNPNRVVCYVDNKKTLDDLDSDMSTSHMNNLFDSNRTVHSEVDRRMHLLKSVSGGIFASICRTCDALPQGVLMLVTFIYRQIHTTFRSSIIDGGQETLNATKLMISKFIMDNLYFPILTSPRLHGITGEKDGPSNRAAALLKEMGLKNKKNNNNNNNNTTSDSRGTTKKTEEKNKKKNAANNKTKSTGNAGSTAVEESIDVSSTNLLHTVSINLEILGDTLRHMASTLPYNTKARWLHSLQNHVFNAHMDSLQWATTMIRMGGFYDLPSQLVDDMYRAHIQAPTTLCTIGLSRIQYMRYCFFMKPDSLISSKHDIMKQLLFAPQGMGLLSQKQDRDSAANFPTECEMSDHRNSTGNGRIEKVSINMLLQTRFLTNKSANHFLQWRNMSKKSNSKSKFNSNSNNDPNSDETDKRQEVQMRSKKWGDHTNSSKERHLHNQNENQKNNSSSSIENKDGNILELYLDAAASVPLPSFLSSPDASLVDTAKQAIGQTEEEMTESANFTESGLSNGGATPTVQLDQAGKIALREVIRSMDNIPDKPLNALQEILSYIRKQQGLPLGQRDWSKAKRYQLAYEYLTVGGSSGNGGIMNDENGFINILCEYLRNIESRSVAGNELKDEIARLSTLHVEAEDWNIELYQKRNISMQYLDELLGTNTTISNNQKTKESLVDRGIVPKKMLTNNGMIRETLEKQYGSGSRSGETEKQSRRNPTDQNVDSQGAFRVSTLGELKSMGTISYVDFGGGILFTQLQGQSRKKRNAKKLDKDISYYFSNRKSTAALFKGGDGGGSSSGGGGGEGEQKGAGSDHFVVTSVLDNDFVIDEFELSTDELVALNKSSLVEWRPTGSNTTFRVTELLAYMKDLQLRELLQKKKLK